MMEYIDFINNTKDKIFEENIGLIYMVIKRFSGRGYDNEELFQIGAIGLLKAIERFDVESGNKFSTYAVPMIIGEIRRFIRDDNLVHLSRKLKEDARKIAIVREHEQKINNKSLTIEELQKMTGLSYEEVVLASEAYEYPQELTEYNKSTMADDKESLINRLLIKQLLMKLDLKERKLIVLRYIYDKTQAQTAEILGMNQVGVSRKEKEILKKMRKQLQV